MNKNIKYLIETNYQAFNPMDLDNEAPKQPKQMVKQDIVDKTFYDYTPKDSLELKILINNLYQMGVKDFNRINTHYITDFSYLFVPMDPGEIDISGWDVSNGKYFRYMFKNCKNLKCDVSNWDVSNGIDFEGMFYECKWMEGDFRNWNFKNALRMDYMFYNCRRILLNPEQYVTGNCAYFPKTNEELKKLVIKFLSYGEKDLNFIDVSGIEDFSEIFSQYSNLYKLGIDKWNVSRGKNFKAMFYKCCDLKADLSNWDVSNGENFERMFTNCLQFNSDISKWNVSSGHNFKSMFWKCLSFNADLTNWDISQAETVETMFHECKCKKPKIYNQVVDRIINEGNN